MSLLLQFLMVLSVSSIPSSSFAVEPEIEIDDGSGGSGSGDVLDVVSGGGGIMTPPIIANPGPANPSGGAASNSAIQIACLDANNQVKNGSPADVCKAVLPKCAALKKSVIDKTKDMLSQKIWGYYNGVDADLARSSSTKLVGNPLPEGQSVCSVVGHKIQGIPNDAELKNQSIGHKASCGVRPRVQAAKSGRKFELKYDGMNGKLWISYMLGAYPWIIRKQGADVLGKLNDELSNLNSILTASGAMSSDLGRINDRMKEFNRKLSAESKASCEQMDSDITAKCLSGGMSISDPAQKLCTIVKAQLAANEGALPNMLAFQIMQQTQKEYDQIFAKLITFENPSMQSLTNACADTGGLLATNRKKKISKTASCFFGGEFCTVDSGEVREAPSAGQCALMERKVGLQTGTVASGAFVVNGEKTRNVGFASVVEHLIRNKICGQSRISDPSICDSIDIPSKPKNVP